MKRKEEEEEEWAVMRRSFHILKAFRPRLTSWSTLKTLHIKDNTYMYKYIEICACRCVAGEPKGRQQRL